VKVSTKGEYGLRALIDLAQHNGQGCIQSGDIARRQRIPEPYLEQILTTLRRAGFIRSVRGPQGGHALVRDPYELRLSEVLTALEGSLCPAPCLDEKSCECVQREVWEAVRESTVKVLDGYSVGGLADKERQSAAGGRYYI
jgi:Rrf2 family transcriptional regulator, cysteine metabolism repressor